MPLPASSRTSKLCEFSLPGREWAGKDFGCQTVDGIELLSMEALPDGYPCYAKLLSAGVNAASFEVRLILVLLIVRYSRQNFHPRKQKPLWNEAKN